MPSNDLAIGIRPSRQALSNAVTPQVQATYEEIQPRQLGSLLNPAVCLSWTPM